MPTPPEAREISGIQDTFEAGQLNTFLSTLIPRARAVLFASAAGGRGGRGGRDGTDAPGPATGSADWSAEFQKPIEYAGKQELQLYMILPARPNAVEYRREQEF